VCDFGAISCVICLQIAGKSQVNAILSAISCAILCPLQLPQCGHEIAPKSHTCKQPLSST
jgi:hypothetical protein